MDNYKKRIVLFFMTVVLISSTLSPAIVGAITESTQSSETTAAPEASTEQSSSTASSELTNATEEEETESSIEETTAETNYEERELSAVALSDSPHPVVRIEEENNASLFVQNENDQQVTRLEKLVLQTKQAGTEWQDEQEYDIEDNYDLREASYSFEYDTELSQRIIIEYSIEESQDGQLVKRTKHMAHYLFKESEKQVASSSEEDSEGGGSSENSETLSSDTIDAKLPDAEISSGQEEQYTVQDSATIPSSPSFEETNPFKRSLRGISPQAAEYVSSKEYKGPGGSLDYMTWITGITKSSANVKGKVPNMGDIQHVYLVWSTNKEDFGSQLTTDQMTNLGNKVLVTTTSTTPYQIEARLSGLQANLDYYIWFYAKTRWGGNYYTTFAFGQPDANWTGGGTGAAGYNYYTFATDSARGLALDPPKITNLDSITKNSVVLGTSNYTGDISQTANDGVWEITKDNTASYSWVGHQLGSIQHDTTRGGKVHPNSTVNEKKISGLKPGTKYKTRLRIPDYGKNGSVDRVDVYSGETTFSTKNAVKPAQLVSNIRPPNAAGKASANFTGSYEYNSIALLAAHPNEVNVKVRKATVSDWGPVLSNTSTPAVNITRNSNGNVAFTVSKLEPKTKYQVAYQVKNDGGFSGWEYYKDGNGNLASFETLATPISVPGVPEVETVNATSAKLKKGSYSKDSKQADLIVQRYSGTGTNWIDVTNNSYKNIPKTGTEYATTNGFSFGGLTPGNKYRSKVRFHYNDTSNQWVDSQLSSAYITPNTVSTPSVNPIADPLTSTSAMASVSGEYQVGTEHPKGSGVTGGIGGKGVQIEVKSPTDANFVSAESKVTELQINSSAATPTISFKLANLKSATRYTLRYRVQNWSNMWSNWGEATFNTRGVKPDISPPRFLQTTAKPTSIYMESSSYTGDLGTSLTHGIIQTESYNVGAEKDWTARVTNLAHDPISKTYAGSWVPELNSVDGLNPGTRYRGWVAFKDYGTNGTDGSYSYKERTEANGDPYYFYTTNSINNLTEPVKGMPTTANNATATFTAGYQAAGQHSAQVAAHPTKVKVFISTDGSSFDEITTSTSGPRLSRDDDINSSAKTVTFKLEGLQENTRYYVKYSVVNQGGESPKSTVYDFITLARPNGFYINQAPHSFDFGTVEMSENTMSHPLQNISGGGNYFSVDFENINMNSQWTLSAKLSELRVEGGQQTLAGSSILMDKELKRTTDGGNTWETPDSTKFDSVLGIQGTSISLPSDGATSIPLFKATDVPYGIGHFENRIAKDSVRLVIPGNTGQKGKTYSGKITWTMDNLI